MQGRTCILRETRWSEATKLDCDLYNLGCFIVPKLWLKSNVPHAVKYLGNVPFIAADSYAKSTSPVAADRR